MIPTVVSCCILRRCVEGVIEAVVQSRYVEVNLK